MNPEQTPEEAAHAPLKQIRTFQGDIAETIHTQNESIVSIQRAEQARKPEVVVEPETPTNSRWKKVLLLILGSIVLIGGGAAGAWYSYNEYQERTAVPPAAIPASRLIAAEGLVLDVSEKGRSDLISQVAENTLLQASPATIHLDLRKGDNEYAALIPIDEFLKSLETEAPGSLVRALNETFMLGVLSGEQPSVFLILLPKSYESVFAGMLNWEETLVQDLGPLFATRELLRNIGPESKFTDFTTRNKDTRVIRDASGSIVLIYSFVDKQTLVITDKEETLHTIINRLNTEKLTR